MTRRISLWVKEHQLITYFILAYTISWIIVAPLVASAQGLIEVPVPFALHYLNDYAPLLAAIITTGIANGAEGLRELFQRMVRWRCRVGLDAGCCLLAAGAVRNCSRHSCFWSRRLTTRPELAWNDNLHTLLGVGR